MEQISPLYLQSVIFLLVASGLSFCWDSHTGHRTDGSLSVRTFLEVLILMRVEDRVVNVDTEAAQCHAKNNINFLFEKSGRSHARDDWWLFYLLQLYLTWNLISFKITLSHLKELEYFTLKHKIQLSLIITLVWSWRMGMYVRNHGWVDWYISAYPASPAPHRITDTDCLALQQYWIFYTFLDYINFVFSSILKFQTPISSRGTPRRLRVGRSFSVPISLIPSRLKVELTSLVDIGD